MVRSERSHLLSYLDIRIDWTSFKALETFMNIVCRASNRIFVGLPLCKSSILVFKSLSDMNPGRDPDFAALNVQFTTDVLQAAVLLRLFPPFLRPCVIFVLGGGVYSGDKNAYAGFRLVNKLISNVPKRTQQSLKYLAPVLAARRKQSEEKPVCVILGRYH